MGNIFNKDQELRVRVEQLEAENQRLRDLIRTANASSSVKLTTKISKERVNAFVEEEILKRDNINCGLIPDVIEKQLYRNAINISLGVIESVLSTTKVEILGHTIEMDIKPKEN